MRGRVMKRQVQTISMMAIGAAALAACSAPVDDPANPAKLGAWSMTSHVDSLAINGMNLGRAALDEQGGADGFVKELEMSRDEACTEPGMRTDAGLAGVLPQADFGSCTVTDQSGNATSGHVTLHCSKQASADLNFDAADISVDSNFEAERGEMHFIFTLMKPGSGGGRDSMAVNFTQQWQRAGECR